VIADNAAPRLHHPDPYVARPRRTAAPSAGWAGGVAQPSTIKAMVMLALGIRGLGEIIDVVGGPWRHLVEAFLLALLALAFFAAAARSCVRRFSWLLSANVAVGLAIAAGSSFVGTASTGAVAETVVVVLLGILLAFACGWARSR
jgi:hypothetical protein